MINLLITPETNNKLSSLKSFAETKEIPNKALPISIAAPLKEVYCILSGKEWDLENNTLFVSIKDKGYFKTYIPKLYKKDGGLVLRWGKDEIPLKMEKGQITPDYPAFSLPEGAMLELSFGTAKLGQWEEITLEITLVTPNYPDGILLNLSLATFKEGLLKSDKEFKTALKTGQFDKIYASLSDLGEVREFVAREKLETLEQGVQYLVTGVENYLVKSRPNRAWGISAIVRPDGYKLGDKVSTEGARRFFANQTIESILESDPSPVINPEYPAELQLVRLDKKKKGEGFKAVVYFQPVKWDIPEDDSDVLKLEW